MIEGLAFVLSLVLTYYIADIMKKAGIVGRDVHKPYDIYVAEMGGISLVFSIALFGAVIKAPQQILTIFLLMGLVGIVDDLTNLRQSHKVLLSALATLPLLTYFNREYIILGHLQLQLSFIAPVVFWLYTIASANLVNMLAGFNGLEVGTSAVIFFFLYLLSGDRLALVALLASLGFLVWNRYPARVFPGDTGTLSLGALMAMIAIDNGLELPLAIMLLPHAIDFLLKMRVKFRGKKIGGAKLREDGTLSPPPYLSFLGLIMRIKRVKEWELVIYVWIIEALLGVVAFSLSA
ncbi:MraY family glycosyltransferase [Thermococcus chitonophagus]|uniref:MraY family glycosyltransferase n=1 Tax=Thermococcus chitonophagus TaxID=54262 RepID=UPI000AAB20BB|nr:glycosyltransferase 4 family protein [Thermococcus chitonophagus]